MLKNASLRVICSHTMETGEAIAALLFGWRDGLTHFFHPSDAKPLRADPELD
ncbi:MAG: hypothetical protein RLN89_11110 [Parvibaculum sp.]